MRRVLLSTARWLNVPVPVDVRMDPVFLQAVGALLPPQVRRDGEWFRAVHNLWRGPDRARIAPALTCLAAVIERIKDNPDERFEDSEFSDRQHVAYAPCVDVFTCDKRTRSALKRVAHAVRARIVQATDLGAIADAVAAVARVAGPSLPPQAGGGAPT